MSKLLSNAASMSKRHTVSPSGREARTGRSNSKAVAVIKTPKRSTMKMESSTARPVGDRRSKSTQGWAPAKTPRWPASSTPLAPSCYRMRILHEHEIEADCTGGSPGGCDRSTELREAEEHETQAVAGGEKCKDRVRDGPRPRKISKEEFVKRQRDHY
eukprot:CAMPEP_0178986670 /NCGR_PEP_ID=MMETSP0795-20121207/2831_1 /TAXON_ID=88552 /ORGANISM="Amoebophrya sp., Strain Ameob2" /LENGTH=157 /DNA_ID=CAMNT_0020677753 /DNA_START=33 /DNA_END=506 /DNA_ORIENTATION=-